MHTKFLILSVISLLTISTTSCTKEEEQSTTTDKGLFTATIEGESFTTNEVVLLTISAGGTQAFTATGTNGKSFSSAIFPSQFPIGQAVNIAYSSSITYQVGDATYIPSSGTMTLTIMENYKRMKGSFTGVFVSSQNPTLTISGEFDIKN